MEVVAAQTASPKPAVQVRPEILRHLPVIQPPPKIHRLFTHSSSKSFRACNYQYYVQYVLGYRPVRPGKALLFGTLIHACLEAYWKARKAGRPAPLEDALAVLVAQKDIDPFDRARARVMLVAYAVVWDTQKCSVVDVEVQFKHDLLNPRTMQPSPIFYRAGKIDLLLEIPDKGLAIVEHKTSSEDVGYGSDYRARLTLDEQVSAYYAGAKALGYKPNFVIYDVLKKFAEKPYEATLEEKRRFVTDKKTKERRLDARQHERDETPEEFCQRLANEVAQDPTNHIERILIYRLQKERVKSAVTVWMQAQIMEHALERGLFPQNSDACFKNRCAFIPHCYQGTPLTDEKMYRKIETLHPELEEDQSEQVDSETNTNVGDAKS